MAHELMSALGGALRVPPSGSVVTDCGQFDLSPGQPPLSVRGKGTPRDWSSATRAVHCGPLVLDVCARGAAASPLPVDLSSGLQLGVRLSLWSQWPTDFGAKPKAQRPMVVQQRWGPELVSRLATTGAARVNLSWWASGARFVGVELVGWSTSPPAAAGEGGLTFDWCLSESVGSLAGDTAWPVSHLVEVPGTSGTPPEVSGEVVPLAHCGMVHGARPTTVSAVNHHTLSPLILRVERELGPVRLALGESVLAPGQGAVVAELDPNADATGLLVSGRLAAAGATPGQATVAFMGRPPWR